MGNSKVCPFAAAVPEQKNSDCLGEACACYVKMRKPRLMQTGQIKTIDSEFLYRYKGCGLVAHVPWELVKREENQKATEPKPLN
jgi:hypothetical protein